MFVNGNASSNKTEDLLYLIIFYYKRILLGIYGREGTCILKKGVALIYLPTPALIFLLLAKVMRIC